MELFCWKNCAQKSLRVIRHWVLKRKTNKISIKDILSIGFDFRNIIEMKNAQTVC